MKLMKDTPRFAPLTKYGEMFIFKMNEEQSFGPRPPLFPGIFPDTLRLQKCSALPRAPDTEKTTAGLHENPAVAGFEISGFKGK